MNTEDHVCPICCLAYTQSVRVAVTCQYCPFTACKSCAQTYVLSQSEPCCMNPECGRTWTRQYVRSVFPLSFIQTTLRKHQETVLFDQERALLPATQPYVERELEGERLLEQANVIYDRIRALRLQASAIHLQIRRLAHPDQDPERSQFIRACPAPECRGFLSTQWKCGVCSKWTCPTCNEVKGLDRDVEHTCDPAQAASIALMRHDTKPCPKCGMGIFKIEGCTQMFCTQCHTAFCWTTGRIETRHIHNPHYFEWLRRQGTELPDVEDHAGGGGACQREVDNAFTRLVHNTMHRKLHDVDTATRNACTNRFLTAARGVQHIQRAELPRFTYDHERNNRLLRVLYMRNRLTEEEFKRKLQLQNKRHQKDLELRQVCTVVVMAMTDILYRFAAAVNANVWRGDCTILDEIPAVVAYGNELLKQIGHTFAAMPLEFNARFELHTARQSRPPSVAPSVAT